MAIKSVKQTIRNTILAVAVFTTCAAGAVATSSSAEAEGYEAGYYAHVVDVHYLDKLNMRKWPAHYSQKIGAIPDNGWGIWVQRCIVKPGSSDWCKVNYAGKWGWVNSKYIEYSAY